MDTDYWPACPHPFRCRGRSDTQPEAAKENRPGRAGRHARSAGSSAECCGQHEVCERDSLLAAVSKKIEYYDDEELDKYIGISPDEYTSGQEEEFRNVFYTMQDTDVAGWMRSLQLRGIALPDNLKDEVFLIIGERRITPHA